MSLLSKWRLIPCLPASGAVQMAIDTWLLEQHRLGLHPPTLRFYSWKPVAISLGYHQRHYPNFWRDLTWNNQPIELVQRPSGGRAVLHQGDLTYAVIVSGLAGTRMQSYQRICEFLIQGWRSLGVELEYGAVGRGYIHNPNCFGTATGADLVTSDGVKLIGSAQLRRQQAILQHGSMRLTTDPDLFRHVFGVELAPLALPLPPEPILPLIAALTAAAQACFQVELLSQPLSESEWQSVLRLMSLSPTPMSTIERMQ
ncbi:lipoate--protein ligase family protein [Leptolyngbya sp. NK1-12]|uniref:Lipoate--protein ligase family protein n=1 Tax=Leptolyngbya sp. NK1-12 TaxID=2547451 RepID=A0AA96WJW1_9CYAN|nr:biotin/lipoate A/B protein ligase family protein [Leptolyngbya sp. NK1-12]WNZ22706.1 lipoate--protein ligase family protein [Leptolyngbya sp. NK1-12]